MSCNGGSSFLIFNKLFLTALTFLVSGVVPQLALSDNVTQVHLIELLLALVISRIQLHVEELAAYLPSDGNVFECFFIDFAPLSFPYLQEVVGTSVLGFDLGLINLDENCAEVISVDSISDVNNAHNL